MTIPNVLYKRDSNGKIRTWFAEISGAAYRTSSGVIGGKSNTSKFTTTEPKNVGRSNEICAEDQAIAEVDAMYKKKVKEGYRYNIDDIDTVDNINPMLAQNYDDYKIEFPVYSQPKLDGFRCNNKPSGGLWSRDNEQFFSVPHIEGIISAVAHNYGVVFDGELYNHALADDFNELQSIISKKSPSVDELQRSKDVVQYHIYDLVDQTRTFSERQELIERIFTDNPEMAGYCVHVDTRFVSTQEELDIDYEQFLEQGYEGQMVRKNEFYQINKRSKTLLKRKEFEDREYKIVGVLEGSGNRSEMAGKIVCALDDGRTFGAGIKGGVKFYQKLWAEKDSLIGKQATIKHFKKLTPDGKPRFPVFKSVR